MRTITILTKATFHVDLAKAMTRGDAGDLALLVPAGQETTNWHVYRLTSRPTRDGNNYIADAHRYIFTYNRHQGTYTVSKLTEETTITLNPHDANTAFTVPEDPTEEVIFTREARNLTPAQMMSYFKAAYEAVFHQEAPNLSYA